MYLRLRRGVAPSLFFLFCSKSAAFTFRQQTHHRPYQNVGMMTTSSDAESSSGKVIVVGSINQDLTTYSRTLPAPGETLLGEDFITSPGGKGGNQAVAAASIGIVCKNGVHMVGRVGDDDMGRSLINSLKSRGVSDEYTLPVSDNHTGVASINVCDSGQNTIIVAPGANLALNAQEVDSALSRLLQNGGAQQNVVLVQLEINPDTALAALQAATVEGALTVLNPAPAPKGWKMTDDWYSTIDILIPNESELASLCGMSEEDVTGEGEEAMALSLLEKGVRHAVIVTLGERGAMIVRRRHGGKQPAADLNYDSFLTSMISEPADLPCKTLPVVDAVGAGDAFCGALSAYLSRGVDLERACSMACGYASMSVRKRGAQESYPLAKDLPECLRLDDSKQESGDANETRGTITFVTGNKNKLLEVQRLLSSDRTQSIPFDLDNAKLDLPELQGSPEQIAREKCETAANRLQSAVMTEDTSLCFHALKGLPGPYIKWFLDDLGHDGLNKLLQGFDDNRAYAQTIIAFSPGPGKEVHLFDGRTEGRIVPPRGALTFGWDPVFEPLPDECHSGGIASGITYAEMTKDDKNKISHRSRAFQKFREFLASSADEVLKDMQC